MQRCKQPVGEGDAGVAGGGDGGWGNADDAGAATVTAGGEASWDSGDAGGGGW